MELKELPRRIPEYGSLNETEVVALLLWWAQAHGGRLQVPQEFLRDSYTTLGRAMPAGGFSSYLRSLAHRSPPSVIKTRDEFRLEHRAFDALDKKYGKREATVYVERILTELPAKLSQQAERTYLEETLICLRNGAFRAAVVMAWNLAYDHLCYWILADTTRLGDFNVWNPKRFAGMKYPSVFKREDFMDMKESHVIEIAKSANAITANVARVLAEKLTRRNMAAHPSDVSTLQPTAEEVIRDLVENVVLKLQ
jgi:hypothetical protein